MTPKSKYTPVLHMEKKIPLKFEINVLNMLIGYLFKGSRQVNRKALTNMKKLFDVIDDRIYDGNEKMEARIDFIQRALKAKMEHGIENEPVLINYCRSDIPNEANDEIINSLERYKRLNYTEITYISKLVQDRLNFAFIYNYKDRLYETMEKIDSGDYDSFREITEEAKNLCRDLLNETRRTSVLDDVSSLSMDDEDVEDKLETIVNTLRDPARILRTGMKRLNQILAPGYMSKRLYMYLGLPAGFKSGILLKTARDIKKYNKDIPSKKAGKRKTVLLITMENTIEESIERLFNMTTSTDDIRKYTPKQVIKMLKDNNEFAITSDDDINIMIKYYPNRSIDTSDLYTIIEDVEDEGREVIALILDYIKRIKPAEASKDEKGELKNVTNELKNLAIDKDIPVISAHQLNRDAASTVDAAMTSKEDVTRYIGRGNVGTALIDRAA